MKPKSSAAKQREAANRIAEIMYSALKKLPREEQPTAVAAVQKVKIVASRKPSTRSATPRNLPKSSGAATARRKRAHL
jgi:hypothetical protein